jgi:hypothetical protein
VNEIHLSRETVSVSTSAKDKDASKNDDGAGGSAREEVSDADLRTACTDLIRSGLEQLDEMLLLREALGRSNNETQRLQQELWRATDQLEVHADRELASLATIPGLSAPATPFMTPVKSTVPQHPISPPRTDLVILEGLQRRIAMQAAELEALYLEKASHSINLAASEEQAAQLRTEAKKRDTLFADSGLERLEAKLQSTGSPLSPAVALAANTYAELTGRSEATADPSLAHILFSPISDSMTSQAYSEKFRRRLSAEGVMETGISEDDVDNDLIEVGLLEGEGLDDVESLDHLPMIKGKHESALVTALQELADSEERSAGLVRDLLHLRVEMREKNDIVERLKVELNEATWKPGVGTTNAVSERHDMRQPVAELQPIGEGGRTIDQHMVHEEAMAKLKEESGRAVFQVKAELEEATAKLKEESDRAAIEVKAEHEEAMAKLKEKSDRAVIQVKAKHETAMDELKEKSDRAAIQTKAEFEEAMAKLQVTSDRTAIQVKAEHEEAMAKLKEESGRAVFQIKVELEKAMDELKEKSDRTAIQVKAEHEAAMDELKETSDRAAIQVKAKHEKAMAHLKQEEAITHIGKVQASTIKLGGEGKVGVDEVLINVPISNDRMAAAEEALQRKDELLAQLEAQITAMEKSTKESILETDVSSPVLGSDVERGEVGRLQAEVDELFTERLELSIELRNKEEQLVQLRAELQKVFGELQEQDVVAYSLTKSVNAEPVEFGLVDRLQAALHSKEDELAVSSREQLALQMAARERDEYVTRLEASLNAMAADRDRKKEQVDAVTRQLEAAMIERGSLLLRLTGREDPMAVTPKEMSGEASLRTWTSQTQSVHENISGLLTAESTITSPDEEDVEDRSVPKGFNNTTHLVESVIAQEGSTINRMSSITSADENDFTVASRILTGDDRAEALSADDVERLRDEIESLKASIAEGQSPSSEHERILVSELVSTKMRLVAMSNDLDQLKHHNASLKRFAQFLSSTESGIATPVQQQQQSALSKFRAFFKSERAITKKPMAVRTVVGSSSRRVEVVTNTRQDAATGLLRIESDMLRSEVNTLITENNALSDNVTALQLELERERAASAERAMISKRTEDAISIAATTAANLGRDTRVALGDLRATLGLASRARTLSESEDSSRPLERRVDALGGELRRILAECKELHHIFAHGSSRTPDVLDHDDEGGDKAEEENVMLMSKLQIRDKMDSLKLEVERLHGELSAADGRVLAVNAELLRAMYALADKAAGEINVAAYIFDSPDSFLSSGDINRFLSGDWR